MSSPSTPSAPTPPAELLAQLTGPVAEAETAYLDHATAELVDIGGHELLADLTSGFAEMTGQFVQAALVQARQGDWAKVATAAHTLRSTAGTLGLKRLGQALAALELAVLGGDFATAQAFVDGLTVLVGSSLATLQRKVASYAP